MAVIHNVWIKGWNSIYQQAPYILERDYTDFIQYCLAWHACLEVHHDGEEEDFFPKVEEAIGKKGFLSVAVDQHGTLVLFCTHCSRRLLHYFRHLPA